MEEFLKKYLLTGLVSLLITSSVLLAEQPAPTMPAVQPNTTPQPTTPSKAKIATDMTEFEFGWIPSDSYVSHTYWFYSRGEDSLRIISVNPG